MAESLVWLLMEVLWKSSVLLALAFAIHFALLRRRPLAADTLWTATLAALFIIPICCVCLPRLPVSFRLQLHYQAPPLAYGDSTSAGDVEAAVWDAATEPSAVHEPLTSMPELAIVNPSDATATSTSRAPAIAWRQLGWYLIAGTYLAGAAWLFCRTLGSLWAGARLRRAASVVEEGRWLRCLERFQQMLGASGEVELLHSESVRVPVAMGWRRPAIIVPSSSIEGALRPTIEAVLLHELTHIVRRDYVVHVAGRLLRCLYWPQPLAWLALRRIDEIREQVCDGFCASTLADRSGYARVLIEFARQLPRRAAPGLGLAMARSSRLERRLVALGGLIVLAPLSRTGVRITSLVAVGALGSLTGLTLLKAETAAPSSDAAAQTNEDQAEGAAPRPAEEAPVEAPTVKSDSAESLELANRLVAAQKQVAELKREDFIAVGMAEVTRPKFAAALRNYEGLRTQVMNQRPPRQPAAEGDNYELYFDGVTSFVELPTLKYIGEVPYTIEAIISPEPIPGYKVNPETHSYAHYMAVIADTEFGGMELSLHPNKLTFEVNSRSSGWYLTAVKPCLPFLEPRMHVAAVVEQNELRLYKNGVLVGSGPFDGTVGLSPLTMRIGCSPHPVTEYHEMFRGCIDEVRFTADALYSDDFAAPKRFEATEATVALYHFDEGRGDRVKDASANGHDGVIHDARWVRAAE